MRKRNYETGYKVIRVIFVTSKNQGAQWRVKIMKYFFIYFYYYILDTYIPMLPIFLIYLFNERQQPEGEKTTLKNLTVMNYLMKH